MVFGLAVVEDDDFTRVMLVNSLTTLGHEIRVESSRPRAALEFLTHGSFDAAILDLHLGKGPTGIDLAVLLRRAKPDLGIVFLTSFEDPRLLRSNLPSLPDGSVYVMKREIRDVTTLNDAILQAVQNAVNPQKRKARGKSDGVMSNLTDTQIELLRLMGLGLSNAEIARRKFVTEKSVEASITRLARSLGVERSQSHNQRVHMAKAYFRASGLDFVDEDK